MDCFVENFGQKGKIYLNPYKGDQYKYWIDKLKETKCCTVVALAVATEQPLDKCFEYMKLYGRKHRKGMFKHDWNKALESMKKYKVKKGPYSQSNRITVRQFLDKHPEGTFYVANNGHAFVIKDGVVIDHTHGLRRQITCAYRVYKKDELGSFTKNTKNNLTDFEKGIFFSASLLYSYWGVFDNVAVVIEQAGLSSADISSLDEFDKDVMIQMMSEYPDDFKFTY